MCYCDDFNNNDFDVSRTRKARKIHWCCECRADITVGESYIEMTVGSDGSVSRFRMCKPCDGDRAVFEKLGRLTSCGSFCWTFGNMEDAARQEIDDAEWEVRDEERRRKLSPVLHTPRDLEPLANAICAAKVCLEALRFRYQTAFASAEPEAAAVLPLGS